MQEGRGDIEGVGLGDDLWAEMVHELIVQVEGCTKID